ncbi:MAG: YpdA family putative bacillithiol disulfide reductase [Bacteroidetes bacterium]|nr:MAG: YpdA family putative bacillithiol disulfide reductase [Bacteroidota bacterium]TAG89854.1 MAG: YpdA family putative bacillithiol disulfide reductase [Bacteroidota bacterium]
MIYDLIIVGGGAIGLACGIAAQKANLNYLIIEKNCLVSSIYNYPTNMTFFSTADRLELGNIPFIAHSDKPTRREALDYYRRVALDYKLKINLYEKVEKINKNENIFELITSKNIHYSKNIVLATGFYDIPNLLNVKGENLPKVLHYYSDPHLYAFQKIIVVGAANSAVDVALECFRRGAEVTMVIREKQIRESVKYWVKPDIENRIKEGSIKAYFEAEIVEIRENDVDIRVENNIISIENNFVLAMTGYQPNYAFLENLGVFLSDDDRKVPFYDQNTHETNQKGVYLAGVVCGGMETNKWFIENSRYHADMIVEHIISK